MLERRGNHIVFNPRLLELSAHYHFTPQPCQVRAGNQKGRVERAIRYVRDSFWAARPFTTLAECYRQALLWRDQVAHQRRWPTDDSRSVEQVFAEEQPRLLPPPLHPFTTDRVETVRSAKTIYVRFDLNDYQFFDHKVDSVATVQQPPLVGHRKFDLPTNFQRTFIKLHAEGGFINRFQQTRPQSPVDFYCCTDDLMRNRILVHFAPLRLCVEEFKLLLGRHELRPIIVLPRRHEYSQHRPDT